ncbi:MAG: hypothetical protein JNM07_01090 [Phycisphaerae bacterium]|nr:hypothetical protein [Phycisphaerae bacterium]
MHRSRSRLTLAAAFVALAVSAAPGWDAHGHRLITLLALDGLSGSMPAWLRDDASRARVAYQSTEPDHWRGPRDPMLDHENSPDHYIDIEKLDQFGLTFDSLPRFRYEYLRAMAVAKHVHPEGVEEYDERKDPERSKEWPGYLPYSIAEHYAKLRASFYTLRILERLNDPARADQVAQARANVEYHMGILSHFVGDAAQPLHTTRHHHGWVGPNPAGYTTERSVHAYIDGKVLELHNLTYDALKADPRAPGTDRAVAAADPWDDCRAHIRRSFDKVEPLYALEKDGGLRELRGKEFITERLTDASAMLAALYRAAWESSAPTDDDVKNFLRFDGFRPAPAANAPPPTP